MSQSPAYSFNSTNSSRSHFHLQDPPKPQKRPRRASYPLLDSQDHREAVVHQDHSTDPHFEPGTSEPQLVLMDDWIRMKIEVPKIYFGILYANMLASLFAWLLLAGFIVLPVTFASIRNSHALEDIGKAGKVVLDAVQNIPFVWIAGTCFVCGVSGLSWLWWENRRNYIWLIDRVFFPTLLHSMLGLITTLVNVYSTQGGHWSVTAVVTGAVTAYISLATMILYVLYTVWTKPIWDEHCARNRLTAAQ